METNVNYTIVGAFVILLLSLLILGIIWLSAGFDHDNSLYRIYMTESVSGLSVGAPVEYNGVNVGSVKSIKINHHNVRLVELLVKVKTDTPVTVETRAKLGVHLLSGIAYILLEDKGKNMTPLKALPNQRFPVIRTVPSILVKIDTILTQLSKSLTQLSNSMKSLLDQQNLQSIKQILFNLHKASIELTPLLQSGKHTIRSIEKATLPITNQAISHFGEMSNNLSDISAEIKQNPSIVIRGEQRTLGPGEK